MTDSATDVLKKKGSSPMMAKSDSGPQVSGTGDEPPAPLMMKRSICCLTTSLVLAASWIISPQIYMGQTTYIWWAVPIISVIAGVSGWFRLNKKSDEEQKPGKEDL